ncbi:MAG TPA: lamin tail domain-containing protein [Chloroflexia bacterium]|nr:lamin tail domain-containing protein [Chloroflexia bacterium]
MSKRPQSRPSAVLLCLLLFAGGLSLISSCTTSNLVPNPSNGSAGTTPIGNGNGGVSTIGSIGSGNNVQANPSGGMPANAPRPDPPQNTYQGCPPTGDGGDPGLNVRKNRTDAAPWYPVTISSLLQLPWPKSLERRNRANWPAAEAAAVAQYEGIPIQLEGWLAGAKQQGPESCNCHSAEDVDNHLWIVDAPNKDRTQSIVIEITPRVRAQHPGWDFSRIRPLVDGQTKVRVSGWLLMDQEHPDQVGKTRGSIWEIHPIIAFDVRRGNDWISLDTGRVATNILAPSSEPDVEPTEDPSLPPPIVETPGPGSLPTATTLPALGTAEGRGATNGAVSISDILYDGTAGPSEPDEYVEIVDRGTTAVNMEGWILRDTFGGQEFAWHGFTIQPGQTIRVYTNQSHPETGGFSFGSGSAIWSNKGDAAELQDAAGTVVSTFAYGNER